ncbi:MAG TPA: hypothetical protein DDZ91_09290, partial [Firmicutes bacterium]|nr:hypothetical protein [Bacillota bacterium]
KKTSIRLKRKETEVCNKNHYFLFSSAEFFSCREKEEVRKALKLLSLVKFLIKSVFRIEKI